MAGELVKSSPAPSLNFGIGSAEVGIVLERLGQGKKWIQAGQEGWEGVSRAQLGAGIGF